MISTHPTSQESPLKKRIGRRNLAHTAHPIQVSSSSGLCLIADTADEATPVKDRFNLTSTTSDEDLVSTNPYITFVAKRVRKLRKRVARIEANESILNSDPNARSKMEPAQLDAVVRKLDAAAPLRELEELLKLMAVRHEMDKKAETADQLKLQAEAKERSKDRIPPTTSVACFIQIVKLFYVLKQLEDSAEYLDNGLLGSLQVLSSFRSKLFLAAEVAELGEDEGRQQWLYDIVMDMVNRSPKPISKDDPRTFGDVITELDNIVRPKPKAVREAQGRGADPENVVIRQSEATSLSPILAPASHACRDVESRLADRQQRSVEGSASIHSLIDIPENLAELSHSVTKDELLSSHDAMGARLDLKEHRDNESQRNRSFAQQERYRTQRSISEHPDVLLAGTPNTTACFSSPSDVAHRNSARSDSADNANVATPGLDLPPRSSALGGSSEANSAKRRTGRQRHKTSRNSARAGGVPEHQVLSMPLLQLQDPHSPQLLSTPMSTQIQQHQPEWHGRPEQHVEMQLGNTTMRQQGINPLQLRWMDQQQQQQQQQQEQGQHNLNHYGHSHPYHQAHHSGQQSYLQHSQQFYQAPPFYYGYHPGFDSAHPHSVGFAGILDDGIMSGGMADVRIAPTQASARQADENMNGAQDRANWGKGERGASKHWHKPKAKPRFDL